MKWNLVVTLIILLGCNASKKQTNNTSDAQVTNDSVQKSITSEVNQIDYSAGPPTIIYKTKNDYYDKIPVTLNDNKSEIVAYPGITDIFYNGKLAYPIRLNNGYLLDNRGINKNVAFLNLTYEEYSRLNEPPLLSEMMKMIIDKEPLSEMYNCGNRNNYKDVARDLNKAIENKELNKFKRIL